MSLGGKQLRQLSADQDWANRVQLRRWPLIPIISAAR
jgi:hypothetical protein